MEQCLDGIDMGCIMRFEGHMQCEMQPVAGGTDTMQIKHFCNRKFLSIHVNGVVSAEGAWMSTNRTQINGKVAEISFLDKSALCEYTLILTMTLQHYRSRCGYLIFFFFLSETLYSISSRFWHAGFLDICDAATQTAGQLYSLFALMIKQRTN